MDMRSLETLHDLKKDDGYFALKQAAKDKKGQRSLLIFSCLLECRIAMEWTDVRNALGTLRPQDISAPSYGTEVSGQFGTGAKVSYAPVYRNTAPPL